MTAEPESYVPSDYLDLHDYRQRVARIYRQRNECLLGGEDPEAVCTLYRLRRIQLLATHPQSPLDEGQRKKAPEISYYAYNANAAVAATLYTDVQPERVVVETGGDGGMPMSRVATAHFQFEGKEAKLTVYWIDVYGGGLFLPFRDSTAPAETYGGGRYLFDTVKGSDFLELPSDGARRRILLDFNYAYNPSCAYNHRWSCPLAPPENRLPFPIPAGERRFAW